MDNRPRGRERNVTGPGKSVNRRGGGLGTGPVGNGGGYSGRGESSGGGKRSGGRRGGSPLMLILVLLFMMLGGGGATLTGLLGGDDAVPQTPAGGYTSSQNMSSGSQSGSGSQSDPLSGLLGNLHVAGVSSGWDRQNNCGRLNTEVAPEAREKRVKTTDADTYTFMVYMCGADLESRSGMATADLQEMAAADLPDNVNIIVYTGGASQWKNSAVSSNTTQIYRVQKGGLQRLESDMGNVPMTSPETLTKFIKYCKKNFPADRNELIFWDHGGGSLTGYGYDEKFTRAGSMRLNGIDQALKDAGVKFDFIGFDACLMATLENALMLANHADYLIASEETEPGVGWFYTYWLNALGRAKNGTQPTLEIGKNIVDSFVSTCDQKCHGQKTTLSVIDLAELSQTVPEKLKAFSADTLQMLQSSEYQAVAEARGGAREFAVSSKIDQVDLVHLADNLGTPEAKELAEALLSAVKYNKTSSSMTNAYGVSIYFPYKKTSGVNTAAATYDAIGMDDSYTECIRKFASLEVGGQAISGGSANPMSALTGGSGYAGTQAGSSDLISQVLVGLLSGQLNGVSGLNSGNSSFLGKGLDPEADTVYLSEHRFDPEQLLWNRGADGRPAMYLSEEQWSMVSDLELNLFMDDGQGFIDLGLDNVFEFTDDNALSGSFIGTWLAIDQQPVAYYHMDTMDDGENYTITGYVPCMLNGERANLILVFSNENPHGIIAGAEPVYSEETTETISKNLMELNDGDVIDFLCDYYTYDGEYQDSYYLGDSLTVNGELTISDVTVDASRANACYRFTDMYQQQYWTPVLPE